VPFSLRYYIVLLGICLAGCSHKGQFPHGNVLTDSVEHVFANTLFPWSCPSFQGGDGTSLEQAVVLSGNSVRFIADRARNDWISRNHPSDKISGSRILITGGEVVEIISIQTFSGASRAWGVVFCCHKRTRACRGNRGRIPFRNEDRAMERRC
jgi:hypothetical protein